jgi:hypothetical protein
VFLGQNLVILVLGGGVTIRTCANGEILVKVDLVCIRIKFYDVCSF